MPLTLARSTSPRVILIAFVSLLAVLAACAPAKIDPLAMTDALVRYERVWPDGLTEVEAITTDGKVFMTHGASLERFTLDADDVERIREALEADIPTGSAEDQPKRTLILADGTVIEAPRPDPGTITDLLDRLMSTHQLG